jgi:hypothetical protein
MLGGGVLCCAEVPPVLLLGSKEEASVRIRGATNRAWGVDVQHGGPDL